jgi:hypothetical protein
MEVNVESWFNENDTDARIVYRHSLSACLRLHSTQENILHSYIVLNARGTRSLAHVFSK